jgi:hypothetical protein
MPVASVAPPTLCTKCQSSNVWRSRRTGWLEKASSLLGSYPYRCHQCSARFQLRLRSAAPLAASEKRKERTKQDRQRKLRTILLFGISLALFVLVARFLILRAPVFAGE